MNISRMTNYLSFLAHETVKHTIQNAKLISKDTWKCLIRAIDDFGSFLLHLFFALFGFLVILYILCIPIRWLSIGILGIIKYKLWEEE
jgi:hypothetical protein